MIQVKGVEKLAGDNQIFGMRLWLRTGWPTGTVNQILEGEDRVTVLWFSTC